MPLPDMVQPLILTTSIAMLYVSIIWIMLIRNHRISSKHLPSVELSDDNFTSHPQPKVSVIIPAKDEEDYIGPCIASLVNQDYSNYEIIVIDDSSNDATRHIMWAYEKRYSNVIFVRAGQRPGTGWYGKNWPCHIGVKKASGDLLLFTDADTEHDPSAMSLAVKHMMASDLDAITLTQKLLMPEFWTSVTIPAVTSFKLVYPDGLIWFTSKRINDKKDKMGGLLGAYFLIKKEVYDSVGGHESVKGELLEDWVLGKKIKSAGHSIKMVRGSHLIQAIWARDLPTLEQVFSRLMMPLVARNKSRAINAAIRLLFMLFMPYPILAGSIATYATYPELSTLFLLGSSTFATLLHIMSYVIQLRAHKVPLRYTIFAPLGGFMASIGFIIGLGFIGSNRGKNVWRNRVTTKKEIQGQ